jgi:uncharacterized protein (TIGR03067 family)
MPVRVAIAAALLFGVAAVRAGDPATSDDKAALQGTWRLTALEIDSQVIPLEKLKDGDKVLIGTLVIREDGYSFQLGKTRLEFTFRVDPTKKPHAIDLIVRDGPDKGKTYHGIYKLEDNTYTICRNVQPDKDRPDEFATRPASGLMKVVWTREKSPASGPAK